MQEGSKTATQDVEDDVKKLTQKELWSRLQRRIKRKYATIYRSDLVPEMGCSAKDVPH
jgi:hypothetical protein